MKINYSLFLSIAFVSSLYCEENDQTPAQSTECVCPSTRAATRTAQCSLCNCLTTVSEVSKEPAICNCHAEVDGRAGACMCEQMAENCQGCRSTNCWVASQDEEQAVSACCQKKSQS